MSWLRIVGLILVVILLIAGIIYALARLNDGHYSASMGRDGLIYISKFDANGYGQGCVSDDGQSCKQFSRALGPVIPIAMENIYQSGIYTPKLYKP